MARINGVSSGVDESVHMQHDEVCIASDDDDTISSTPPPPTSLDVTFLYPLYTKATSQFKQHMKVK